jgi:hypothetical protein
MHFVWFMVGFAGGWYFEPSASVRRIVKSQWPSRGFDGVMTGTASGALYECFDPAWHELGRWAWWWTCGHELGRGTVVMTRDDIAHRVRVFVPPPVAPARRFRGRRHHD